MMEYLLGVVVMTLVTVISVSGENMCPSSEINMLCKVNENCLRTCIEPDSSKDWSSACESGFTFKFDFGIRAQNNECVHGRECSEQKHMSCASKCLFQAIKHHASQYHEGARKCSPSEMYTICESDNSCLRTCIKPHSSKDWLRVCKFGFKTVVGRRKKRNTWVHRRKCSTGKHSSCSAKYFSQRVQYHVSKYHGQGEGSSSERYLSCKSPQCCLVSCETPHLSRYCRRICRSGNVFKTVVGRRKSNNECGRGRKCSKRKHIPQREKYISENKYDVSTNREKGEGSSSERYRSCKSPQCCMHSCDTPHLSRYCRRICRSGYVFKTVVGRRKSNNQCGRGRKCSKRKDIPQREKYISENKYDVSTNREKGERPSSERYRSCKSPQCCMRTCETPHLSRYCRRVCRSGYVFKTVVGRRKSNNQCGRGRKCSKRKDIPQREKYISESKYDESTNREKGERPSSERYRSCKSPQCCLRTCQTPNLSKYCRSICKSGYIVKIFVGRRKSNNQCGRQGKCSKQKYIPQREKYISENKYDASTNREKGERPSTERYRSCKSPQCCMRTCETPHLSRYCRRVCRSGYIFKTAVGRRKSNNQCGRRGKCSKQKYIPQREKYISENKYDVSTNREKGERPSSERYRSCKSPQCCMRTCETPHLSRYCRRICRSGYIVKIFVGKRKSNNQSGRGRKCSKRKNIPQREKYISESKYDESTNREKGEGSSSERYRSCKSPQCCLSTCETPNLSKYCSSICESGHIYKIFVGSRKSNNQCGPGRKCSEQKYTPQREEYISESKYDESTNNEKGEASSSETYGSCKSPQCCLSTCETPNLSKYCSSICDSGHIYKIFVGSRKSNNQCGPGMKCSEQTYTSQREKYISESKYDESTNREKGEMKCPPDEIYTSCEAHASCLPTCNTPDISKGCSICQSGCICKKPLVRREKDNKCVIVRECRKSTSLSCAKKCQFLKNEGEEKCFPNEKYTLCEAHESCIRTCKKPDRSKDCQGICQSGCICKEPLIRREKDNKCVFSSECPKEELSDVYLRISLT